MKIGMCGGTFDPFHRGHLEPVFAAREAMQWDRIIYFVAYRQPFKEKGSGASAYHRFAMAVLATERFEDVYGGRADVVIAVTGDRMSLKPPSLPARERDVACATRPAGKRLYRGWSSGARW